MSAVAGAQKKYEKAKKQVDWVLAAIGLVVVAYAVYNLAVDLQAIAKQETAYDFFVPPLLTLLFIPFLYFMVVYSAYE